MFGYTIRDLIEVIAEATKIGKLYILNTLKPIALIAKESLNI